REERPEMPEQQREETDAAGRRDPVERRQQRREQQDQRSDQHERGVEGAFDGGARATARLEYAGGSEGKERVEEEEQAQRHRREAGITAGHELFDSPGNVPGEGHESRAGKTRP